MTGQSAIPAPPASEARAQGQAGRVRPECTCVFTISRCTHACSSETTYAALTAQGQPEKKKQRRSAGWRDRGRGEHRWRVCSHITNLVIVDIEERSGLFKSQVTIKQVRGWRGNGLTRLICTFLTDVNWLFFALFNSASASDIIQPTGPKSRIFKWSCCD